MRVISGNVCVFSIIALAGLGLCACGRTETSIVVARVGDHFVTKANLVRWTAIEAILSETTEPTRAPPKGLVPDPPTYANCIAFLRSHPKPGEAQLKPSTGQLKNRCDEEHRLLQRHILDILLIAYWLKDEASEKGVRITNGEIEQVLHRIFPKRASFRRYLAFTGEHESDERLIIEKDLLDSRLLKLKEAEQAGGRQVTVHERQLATIEAAREFTSKWAARTWCRAGYVVSECKQFAGKRSLIEP